MYFRKLHMKNYYNIKLLLLVCLVFSLGFLTSCEDDEEIMNNGQVNLLSFGPTGAKHGETIKFIGSNLNKVESIELPNATITKDQFVSQTDELIELVIPTSATAGKVILKVNGGEDVTSKTVLSFEVPVTITAIPAEAKPGTNITITGNYVNWVEGIIFGESTDTVKTFVSQSLNELVVQVPMNVKSGFLKFLTGGTEPMVIETENQLTVSLPAITGLAPIPVARETELTITGTNLDLTRGVLFKSLTKEVTDFVSKTPTELVVKVPKDAARGAITLVTYSGVMVESQQLMQIVGDLPLLGSLPYAIFDEARRSGWDDWGWGGASVWNSTERVREGDRSAKKTFTGGDAIRAHANTAVSLANYTELTFSVYGNPGTGGKNLKLILNEAYGAPYTFAIEEGQWKTYMLKLADLGKPATLNDLLFQAESWTGVVYFDHIGLK